MSDLISRQDAISAAEPEPVCEDCISRQDVMEALDRIGSLDTEADREYAKGIFDNIPPTTPTERTGWIPVSGGLPEEEKDVLICISGTYRDSHVIIAHRTYMHTYKYWADMTEEYDYDYDDVLAWMPLPEPYDGGVSNGDTD